MAVGEATMSRQLCLCLMVALSLLVASAEAEGTCTLAGKWQASVSGENLFAVYNGTTTYDFSSSGAFSLEMDVQSDYTSENATTSTPCDFTYTADGNFRLNNTDFSTNFTSCAYTDCNTDCQFLCDADCDANDVWLAADQDLSFANHCKSFTTEEGVTFDRLPDWFWLITVSIGAVVVLSLAVGIVVVMWMKRKQEASQSPSYIDITDG